MKKNRYYPAEVIYICWLLDDTCENIFGVSFADLVLFDGPGDTVEYVKKRFLESSKEEKQHLMDLIGFQVTVAALTTSDTHKAIKPVAKEPKPLPEPDFSEVEFKDAPPEEKFTGDADEPFSFEMIDINLITATDEDRFRR